MSRLLRPLIALFALLLLGTTAALAQPYTYHVYLDTDLREITGCTVTGPGGQSFVGAQNTGVRVKGQSKIEALRRT